MRKRKALSSVDGNILSKPPIRRLRSDDDFSMESWEERALADSKTPKISNVGGSPTIKPTERRKTHRRPPLPTRPKHGGLGSSILDASRHTPRKVQRGGISSRSPKRESSDRFTQGLSHLTPRQQSFAVIPRQAPKEQPQLANMDKPSCRYPNNDIRCTDSDQLQTRQGNPKTDTSRNKLNTKPASRSVIFPPAKEFASHSASASPNDCEAPSNGKHGGEALDVAKKTALAAAANKKDSDDDMNCDSSDEDTLLNSSNSSPEEQRGSNISWKESQPGTMPQRPKSTVKGQRQLFTDGRYPRETSASTHVADQETKKGSNYASNQVENRQIFDPVVYVGTTTNIHNEGSLIVGSTIGNTHFANEELAEDTDLTDMTSLSSDGENTSHATCDVEDDEVDEDEDGAGQIESRSKDRQSDTSQGSEYDSTEIENNKGAPRTARRLTFDDSSPASAEESSMQSGTSDSMEEESFEAWSIDGYSNSPILIKIDGRKYIHPPLPAGWRIKISKTHKRPIYIHPDIGRTFHCPVDLPRNVMYVRRKDGKLEKRAKIDFGVATDSPRAGQAPDTPPSVTQESPERCSKSPSPGSVDCESESSTATSDSTSRLIRGALKLSALCVKNSSQTLQEAEMLMSNARGSPSTMSDVVRLYETEKTNSVNSQQPKYNDGYDCDVSDSGRSRDSLSSSSSIHKMKKEESFIANVLSPVLETPMTTKGHQSDEQETEASDSHVEEKAIELSGSNQNKQHPKNSSIDEGHEKYLTPHAQSEDRDRTEDRRDSNPDNATTKMQKSSVPASAQDLVPGEYIDGWFTPKVSGDKETVAYEEVTILRHSARRRQRSIRRTPNSNSKKFRQGSMTLTGSVKAQVHQRFHITDEHTANRRVLNIPHPHSESIDPPPEKEKGSEKKGKTNDTINKLLPFFDIFERHQVNECDNASHLADVKATNDCNPPDIQDNPTDLKGRLPDWNSPNCSGIEGSSPHEKNISSIPAFSPSSSKKKKVGSGSDLPQAADTSVKAPLRQEWSMFIEQGGNVSNPVLSGRCEVADEDLGDTPGSRLSEPDIEVPHSTTMHTGDEKARTTNESIQSPVKTGSSDPKRSPDRVEVGNDVEFHTADDQSPDISTEGFPGPDVENSPNKDSKTVSEPSQTLESIRSASPKSQNESNDHDDFGLGGDDSEEYDNEKREGSEFGFEGTRTSSTISIKGRRMSWRVLNPTYPLCSLQRLDEIALRIHKKKRCSLQRLDEIALRIHKKKRSRSVSVKKKRKAKKKDTNKKR